MAVLLKPYGSTNWEKKELGKLVEVIGVPEGKGVLTEEEIIKEIENVDILQADVDIRVTRRLLKHGTRLRAVICTSIGVDYVDIDAATECGVIVSNNPDFCVIAVAEYAIGMILALIRHIPKAAAAVKEGNWGVRNKLGGVELLGKTLGVVGLGKTGREVTIRAHAFGMKVIAYSPNAGPSVAASVGAELVSLEELLCRSDIITIHTSLRDDTYNLIGNKEFKLIKEGAYFVNVARGGIVDEEALTSALISGRLAGAALDVLTLEPPREDNSLLEMDNVLITPHIAWNTAEAREKTQKKMIEQIKAVLEGKAPPHVVNPEVLPRWKKRISNL